jgi:hypothetical protein
MLLTQYNKFISPSLRYIFRLSSDGYIYNNNGRLHGSTIPDDDKLYQIIMERI